VYDLRILNCNNSYDPTLNRSTKTIIGAAGTMHDQSWYDGETHWIAERHTRIKGNRRPGTITSKTGWKNWCAPYGDTNEQIHKEVFFPMFDEYDTYAFTMPRREDNLTYKQFEHAFDYVWNFEPRTLFDHYYDGKLFYADHHQSHAVYAYLQSGFTECDILAVDGGAAKFTTFWCDSSQRISNLTEFFNLGRTWLAVTSAVGWEMSGKKRFWQENETGKVMGMAGYGKINYGMYSLLQTLLAEGGDHTNLADHEHRVIKYAEERGVSAWDLSATMQKLNNDEVEALVRNRKSSDNICLSGGVAYNGYMNEILTKVYDNVYVPPAVGDEGQSVGIYMMADYVINNNVHIPKVYAGVEHEVKEEIFVGMKYKRMRWDDLYEFVADSIANGAIVGWYQGRSESGNRALGNRSILADPRNPHIKQIINEKVKLREDFRPFAPSVLIEDYMDWFDTNQPSPYMSRIMPVREEKREIIPGVTHVDGTARIQTVDKSFNEKYWNLINEFKKCTGVPMVLNTSFNCQEPIVETPEEALATFKRVGLDILVIENYVVVK
jgi:carbamoyltransferase